MVKLPDELIQSFKERRKQEASLGLRGYGRKRIVDALAEIDDALKDVADPAVRSHDQEAPAYSRCSTTLWPPTDTMRSSATTPPWMRLKTLPLLSGFRSSLGNMLPAIGRGAEALRERLCAAQMRRETRNVERQTVGETPPSGFGASFALTKRSISQPHLAAIIKAEVPAARSVSERQIIETIRLWVRESGSCSKLAGLL